MAEAETQAAGAAGSPQRRELDEFAALLKKEFKPKSDEANEAVERAVETLAEQALADTTRDLATTRSRRSRRSSPRSTRSSPSRST